MKAASTTATDRVRVRELGASEFDAWRGMVAASEQGSVYALPEYLEALCRAANATFRIVAAYLDDQLVGGIPLFERRSRAGTYVANRLLLYYNGIVLRLPPKKWLSDRATLNALVLAALATDLEQRGYAHLQLHNRSPLDDVRPFLQRGWAASLSYTYVVSCADPTEQWEKVDPNLKRLISRCERDGVTYREDGDLDALFRLHLQTHQRKGAPLYLPESAFRRFYDDIKNAGLARLGHAVLNDQVIASQLMLTGPHPVGHIVCAGADEQHLKLGANGFLRWHSLLA
ncbi:MAG: GNAT family N-acetyltransferase, partial [Burkholderiaceae bacterium]